MNIRDFKKGFEINTKYLDQIEFTAYLLSYQLLGRLMAAVEEDYDNSYNMPPELEGNTFNFYSEEEFKDYLEKRYPTNLWFYPVEDYLIDFRRE